MGFILGETNEDLIIETVEECQDIVNALARQARHSINIFTQDMDAALYDNDIFDKHIFDFASENKNAKMRILVQDSSRAIRDGHRLLRLTQKLTSFISIRNPCEEFKAEKSAFITVDGVGLLYRAKGDRYNYHGAANFMSPPRTAEIDSLFTEIWQQSEPDPRTRRFLI
jgi:hypothetical protein